MDKLDEAIRNGEVDALCPSLAKLLDGFHDSVMWKQWKKEHPAGTFMEHEALRDPAGSPEDDSPQPEQHAAGSTPPAAGAGAVDGAAVAPVAIGVRDSEAGGSAQQSAGCARSGAELLEGIGESPSRDHGSAGHGGHAASQFRCPRAEASSASVAPDLGPRRSTRTATAGARPPVVPRRAPQTGRASQRAAAVDAAAPGARRAVTAGQKALAVACSVDVPADGAPVAMAGGDDQAPSTPPRRGALTGARKRTAQPTTLSPAQLNSGAKNKAAAAGERGGKPEKTPEQLEEEQRFVDKHSFVFPLQMRRAGDVFAGKLTAALNAKLAVWVGAHDSTGDTQRIRTRAATDIDKMRVRFLECFSFKLPLHCSSTCDSVHAWQRM